ncbi:hypothetical protein S2091_1127 [Solimicrobium silvestre]|uniref:Uncharacterized protein n=1 Tax=Solimicrobium silvestre TaxID=2099400 RepID=A0A2S9H1U0_9BURK|nr:hypothetical protein S2091_1127 [Solimicrobium silvestre]
MLQEANASCNSQRSALPIAQEDSGIVSLVIIAQLVGRRDDSLKPSDILSVTRQLENAKTRNVNMLSMSCPRCKAIQFPLD